MKNATVENDGQEVEDLRRMMADAGVRESYIKNVHG